MNERSQSGANRTGRVETGRVETGRGLCAGIDIGTTAVKAVAVDEDGNVLARARLASAVAVGPGDRLEHEARSTWWDAPRSALKALELQLGAAGVNGLEANGLQAVAISAMMPSVAPVDDEGRPLGAGLLYGSAGPGGPGDPTSSDEMARLAGLAASAWPGAQGYWPAQAVANASLGGEGVVDLASAFAFGSLFNGSGWEEAACQEIGLRASQLPRVIGWGEAVGHVGPVGAGPVGAGPVGAGPVGAGPAGGTVLGVGSVDGLCEQLVAGALTPGDVLVTLGSTLVVWLCVPGWPEGLPLGLWRVPHLAGGMALVGGASNAGGLWVDWVDRVLAPSGEPGWGPAGGQLGSAGASGEVPSGDGRGQDGVGAPANVPVWWPWARGERVPWHDTSLRVSMAGAGVSQGPAQLRRAALEATGFVVRNIVELAASCGTAPRRYLVSGGGVSKPAWLQALAEALGEPVVPMAVPDGAALGAAFLARMAAGLESSLSDAARWARWAPAVEPRPEWVKATSERYELWAQGLPKPAGRA